MTQTTRSVGEQDALAAFVGVTELRDIDGRQLAATLAEGLNVRVQVVEADGDRSPPGMTVLIEGRGYAILAIPFAVPMEDLAVALQTAYGWPGARSAALRAQAHYIVSPQIAASGHADVVKQAAELTSVVSALAAVSAAEFVFWAPGDVIARPDAFRQSATGMALENRLPVLSWVQFRLLPGKPTGRPGTVGMVTTGLRSFVGYEVRVEPFTSEPALAAKLTARVVEYLLRQGDVIKDGDNSEVEGFGQVGFTFGSVSGMEGTFLQAQLAASVH